VGALLTATNLLKSVGIANEEVEYWSCGAVSHSGMQGSNPKLEDPLSPPDDGSHLEIIFRIKTLEQHAAANDGSRVEISATDWQELDARWNTILRAEATIASSRISMEGVRGELEASSTKMLTTEEKLHALNADVVHWNQAKSRVLFTLPKARDFIHRAIWGLDTPERKELDEFFKIRSAVSLARLAKVRRQLEGLLKDRLVLSAEGTTVYNECQRIVAEVQGSLRSLQSNAAANAVNKRAAARAQGKYF
jgi:hypothetical protein